MHFLTRFLRITLRILFCWSISREMFNGRSSLSTTPRMKFKYSGIRSSQLSMMNTRRTYSLMLFLRFLPSNRSNGARLGANRSALNSSCPSTEKCFTARCSSQSLVRFL
uniref:Secreted protein n=1 Tax=Cacopsylla melanoneura TaxID=428564 RepID=A0A8D8T718_9HEMI